MNKKQKRMLCRIIASALLLAVLGFVPASGPVRFGLYMVPYLIVGRDILRRAVRGILRGQVLDENFLMAVATVGAVALGEYAEATAVMLFYQIGELFENVAVGRSRRSISRLMDIRPDCANLETGDGVSEVDPDEVPVGSVIIVRPGEKIPIDGVIIQGSASLDTVALTGESVPRDVSEGDGVISGCINMSGVLRIRTTKEFGESTVSKILELVENSSSRKSRSEQFISRFARVYTPAVCISALVLGLGVPLVRIMCGMDALFGDWIYRALTFLVISCPCALVISIPLTFFAGLGGSSRAGVLIKGSNFMETLSRTGCVVFDKTGTLTQGVFQVTKVAAEDRDRVLELAAMAESLSDHPISRSIAAAWGGEPDPERISDMKEISGRGVSAVIDGKSVLCGNRRLMEENGVICPGPDDAGTVVHVADEGEYLGYILISDALKPSAREAIRALRHKGVKRIVMLTGDNEAAASRAAEELGVDEYHSGLLPADKVARLEKLLESRSPRETVAFVGDGINDAPVLARADIGIAMGALGSDAAIEAADVVLMDDDPAKIVTALGIAGKCMRIVYENIWFAIGVKLICLVLGALGIANMWLAIFADVGVMVLAVLNAIRAMKLS